MKKILYIIASWLFILTLMISCSKDDSNSSSSGNIIDRSSANLSKISSETINKVRAKLRIAYGHSSWAIGDQIIEGMNRLVDFKGSPYDFSNRLRDSVLYLNDDLLGRHSLANYDDSAWYNSTRDYLTGDTLGINVVIWCWGREVSDIKAENIDKYLSLMSSLETEFTNVKFVYMTGAVDGTSTKDNLYLRNEQIRKYCREKGKILYDFASIESYDPDGKYFGDKNLNENCTYDKNGKGDGNWAREWQGNHKQGVDWFNTYSNETEPLSINLKAYAAWSLWARLAQ
jgi:hypothetical protein